MITLNQLKLIIPYNRNPTVWIDPINQIVDQYQINTNLRLAAFLAECAHESTDFMVLEENLNYKAGALMSMWPAHFPTLVAANLYAGNPQKIANLIYSNKNGNGSEASGDGWNYRGRGLIQLTGKSNYQFFATSIGYLLEDVPTFLATPAGAVQSACYYWQSRPILNTLADSGDIDRISKLINGGINGLADRHQRYTKAISILGK